jgi:hypothetical protein
MRMILICIGIDIAWGRIFDRKREYMALTFNTA